MKNIVKVAPSLLAADFTRLGEEIRRVEQAGADLLHVDVMDGHFVPNITMGPFIVKAIKRAATVPLNVHLMISDPLRYAGAFVKAGADRVVFHREVVADASAAARAVRAFGVSVGISINPGTQVDTLFDVLDEVDEVLVMTVEPGFGGQEFMAGNLSKIVELRRRKPVEKLDIAVDGGIDLLTAPLTVEAGANVLISGTFIFGSKDVVDTIRRLHAVGTRD